jgi:hypothetical protein
LAGTETVTATQLFTRMWMILRLLRLSNVCTLSLSLSLFTLCAFFVLSHESPLTIVCFAAYGQSWLDVADGDAGDTFIRVEVCRKTITF